jgi:homoserine dehydrogenase
MRKINIGLIGLGNVGSELYKMIQNDPRFEVRKIAVKDKGKKRSAGAPPELLTEKVSEIIYDPNISVTIDASNDLPENIFERIVHKKEWVPRVFLKPYILASKKTMAFYGEEILRFSRENGMEIGFEATVCAGIPIVRTLREGHIPEKIVEVGGILNGTTNYILTRMYYGASYEEALYEAQRLGYAEADPTEDVSGLDSACKLIILCGLCFGRWPKIDEVGGCGIKGYLEEIERVSKMGLKYCLLAKADSFIYEVEPRLICDSSLMDRKLKVIEGVENLVYIKTATRTLYFSGPGAGGKVTAAAMMSDLNYIASKLSF